MSRLDVVVALVVVGGVLLGDALLAIVLAGVYVVASAE